MEICSFCGKEGKSVKYHIWRMHGAGQQHNPNKGYADGSRKAWNKGFPCSDDQKMKVSKKLKGKPRTTPISDQAKEKLSKIAIERGFGCGNKNSYAHGWYESPTAGRVWLESSYEYSVAKELDENQVNWTRPKHFEYELDGKIKRYFPDFYLNEFDVYLDPKNDYLISKDSLKIEAVQISNNISVLILSKDELTWEAIKARLV